MKSHDCHTCTILFFLPKQSCDVCALIFPPNSHGTNGKSGFALENVTICSFMSQYCRNIVVKHTGYQICFENNWEFCSYITEKDEKKQNFWMIIWVFESKLNLRLEFAIKRSQQCWHHGINAVASMLQLWELWRVGWSYPSEDRVTQVRVG